MARIKQLALIGFGEAGAILGHDLVATGLVSVAAYDILVEDPLKRDALLDRARAAGVRAAPTLAAALDGADLILSAVTADRSFEAASAAASVMARGQVYLDINSCSPDSKRANCRVIEAAGGNYVEAAVMGPVPPSRLKVQMLLGGAYADSLAPKLRDLGLHAEPVSLTIGVASAIKMCRSVMIKGIEALTVECLFAARQFGAEALVLQSLATTFPSMGWDGGQPDYLISRVAEHGRRRAAEMREVAATLEGAGAVPLLAAATALRQDWLVDQMAEKQIASDRTAPFDWRALADRLNRA